MDAARLPSERELQADDERFMREAIELSKRGQGFVEPNPMVGCVLVRDGKKVGQGFHQSYGGPHA
ncbi:MAG: riboflavin biosynthesis protein RibD, partial [Planctomycetota bacterium]